MRETSEVTPHTIKNIATLDPKRLPRMLSLLVLAFIPINMLFSPVFDFVFIEVRQSSWTVSISAYVFILASMPLLIISVLFLKSRREKIFIQCTAVFFLYAFLFTLYSSSDLFYPIFGLVSALGSTLIGVLFYVLARDNITNPKIVIHFLAFASIFVVMPVLLVQTDTARFAQLSERFSAIHMLYGYENPRALGWISTIFLSFLAAHLSTLPKENRIQPIFLLLVIICAISLFWSGSRGGIFAFTLSFIIVFSFSKTKNIKGTLSVLSCIASGGIISCFLYLPSNAYGFFGRISQNLEQDSITSMSSGRVELWQATISYIAQRPLTGYGYLPNKSLEGLSYGSAHNIILDYWLWFGLIIGTIVLLSAVLLWAIAFSVFLKANNHYISALFCVVTTLLAYSMISGPYARTFPLLIFAVSSGVLLGFRSSKDKLTNL